MRWVGLMAAGDELEQAGLDFDTAMRRIHVREADGRLVSGVPAFVVIWRRLPAYRLLAGGVERLGLTRPLEWGYARFAERRYRKRCRDGACGIGR
ncbi:thiol-disulfide oxidoreductase DCC family protein [Thiohalocapsa marina]|uniref:thiol-disulfide oxidoreductase DCC family protein n=1 Tax=Thiohalocapsa marina TaxID=424902 RepID=UPI0024822B19|nr:DCC1-like thiol-disulfide oxidoreductase family protein [Thiohalocapsa marina]